MPVYLLHGFRWERQAVRVHVILQNLDEVAPDWLMGRTSQRELRMSLVKLYPEMMAHLPNFRFIEEYHPEQTTICAPYAYVADTVIEVMTNIDIDEARGSGLSNEAWAAMTELRDKLAAEAKLGWYVVNCADDQRRPIDVVEPEILDSGLAEKRNRGSSFSRGLKKVFGKKELKHSASLRDLKHPGALRSSTGTSFGATTPSPPLPPILAQYQEQMAQMKATNVGGSGAAESNRERSESGASKTSSRQSQKAPAIDERRRVPIPARPSTSGAALPASMSNVRNRRANGIGRAQ